MPLEVKQFINQIDNHKNENVLILNIEISSIVNIFNNVLITCLLFTQYKSTEFDDYGRNFECYLQEFTKTHIECLFHP